MSSITGHWACHHPMFFSWVEQLRHNIWAKNLFCTEKSIYNTEPADDRAIERGIMNTEITEL